MARTLYRIYLYIVALVMLGFAGVGLGGLLHTLLLKTPLRGPYETAPAGAELVQTSVLAATALVVALALGGLHYWLIRRDIAADPSAAGGAVRALLLNLAQAVAAVIALFMGATALNDITLSTNSYNRGTLALPFTIWLVSALIAVLLQLERGRGRAAEGAPRNIERLHLYFLQLLALLAGMIGYWTATVSNSFTGLFYAAGAIPNPCGDPHSRFYLPPFYGPPGINEPRPVCDFPQALGGEWLAALWVALVVVAYIWLARRDPPYVLRVLAHALGFLTGAIVAIVGIGEGASLALRIAFGVEEASAAALATRLTFVATLLLGGIALWWYRRQLEGEAATSPLGRQGTDLTIQAIATVALGVPFYLGVTFLLRDLVERVVPSGNVPAPEQVASDLAILIAGVAYPMVALLLRRNTTAAAPIGPRRTVVLAGLAAGALAGAIGLAVGLYYVITAGFGSPVGDWQVNARMAFIVLLVGAFLTGLNLYRLLTDRRPEPPLAPKVAPAPTAPAGSIERVLDDLVAGRLSREQAAAALRALGAR